MTPLRRLFPVVVTIVTVSAGPACRQTVTPSDEDVNKTIVIVDQAAGATDDTPLPGTSCAVNRGIYTNAFRVRVGQRFAWKFFNQCKEDLVVSINANGLIKRWPPPSGTASATDCGVSAPVKSGSLTRIECYGPSSLFEDLSDLPYLSVFPDISIGKTAASITARLAHLAEIEIDNVGDGRIVSRTLQDLPACGAGDYDFVKFHGAQNDGTKTRIGVSTKDDHKVTLRVSDASSGTTNTPEGFEVRGACKPLKEAPLVHWTSKALKLSIEARSGSKQCAASVPVEEIECP